MDRAVPIILAATIGGFVGSVCGAVVGVLVGLGLEAIVVLPLGYGAFFGWFIGAWLGLVIGAVGALVWTRRALRSRAVYEAERRSPPG